MSKSIFHSTDRRNMLRILLIRFWCVIMIADHFETEVGGVGILLLSVEHLSTWIASEPVYQPRTEVQEMYYTSLHQIAWVSTKGNKTKDSLFSAEIQKGWLTVFPLKFGYLSLQLFPFLQDPDMNWHTGGILLRQLFSEVYRQTTEIDVGIFKWIGFKI